MRSLGDRCPAARALQQLCRAVFANEVSAVEGGVPQVATADQTVLHVYVRMTMLSLFAGLSMLVKIIVHLNAVPVQLATIGTVL